MSLKKGNSAAAAGAVATLAILSIAVLVMVRKYVPFFTNKSLSSGVNIST